MVQHKIGQSAGVSLGEVLPEGRLQGARDIRITSCCADSRRCQPGDLFVALMGSEHDGHHFAQEAVSRGATAVVSERTLPVGVPTCVVSDTRDAFGRICQALAGSPSQTMSVIGVTGTSGKTTTSLMITAVLEAADCDVGIMGTLGYCDTVETVSAPTASPQPPELANWLARMQANGCSHAVLELSSVALASRQAAGIEFEAACVTNVRRNHLDYHGSLVNYRNAKGKLFQQLRPSGFAVINADDPCSNMFLSKLENPVLTIGTKRPAELTGTVVERHKSEQTFLMSAGNDTIAVRTHMIGDHHVYNCLSAAAVGMVYGIDLPTIARGLESVSSIPQRMERIECGQPFGVFLDQAQNADALATVLKSLRAVTKGRLICVLGAAGDQDKDKRPLMGRVAERSADLSILTSQQPGTEPPLAIIHDILDGYDRPSSAHVLPDRAKAICWTLQQARAGDTILIAAQGGFSPQFAGQPIRLDERALVRGWLIELAKTQAYQPWYGCLGGD